jgi:hypothetical protein
MRVNGTIFVLNVVVPTFLFDAPAALLVIGPADKMIFVTETVESLVLDLLEWISLRNRTYPETMDAWRTSCPKLPVWEDATDLGLVNVEHTDGHLYVHVTHAGYELLAKMRPDRVL